MNQRECQPQAIVMNHAPSTTVVKEIAMRRCRSILLAALATTLIHCSLTQADSCFGYSIFDGFNNEDYECCAKYQIQGIVDALEAMGLSACKRIASTPWQFYENSFIDSYSPYDSIRADYSTVTVHCGHAGTFRDAGTNEFYFLIGARDEWQGSTAITSDIVRLGESYGYLPGDTYPGYCRYFMALGCNTIAIGPAMSADGQPTYSRPDLFDTTNPSHANPFKIWRPVMTDGLRMAMGYTDYSYASSDDYGKWLRLKDYHNMGYSIARSFAYTALDAHGDQKPVVLTMGEDQSECEEITNEWDFHTDRPRGNNYLYYTWWGTNRVRDYDGSYVWDGASRTLRGPDKASAGVDEAAPLPTAGWVYKSRDSGTAEEASLLRYLNLFGCKGSTTLYAPLQDRASYKIVDGREVSLNRRTDSLCYRDAEALAMTGASKLTEAQCVDRATSFLVGNQIIGPDEVQVDSVISETHMAATAQEIVDGSYSSEPQVARYTVVFKRNIGELPILTNDVDTIRVEIGQNGKITSLISRYKYGRKITKLNSVKGALPNIRQARTMLATAGDVKRIKAGMLPMPDGTYLPVYEVTTVTFPDGLLPCPQITYRRMDTLEPVDRASPSAGDNHELESDEASPERSR